MTTEEFSREVGLVFQAEWRAARRWAVIRSFVWGIVASSTVWVIALRCL
jgi:hypothetical protein